MRLVFHPEALAEFKGAARHYESLQAGLGMRFYGCVEETLRGIEEAPTRWPVLEKEVRRRLTRVFPYAVLFAVDAERIFILAIMHCHQKPGYWRGRDPQGP
jgi:hypothetical protein